MVKVINQLIPLGHPNRKGIKTKPIGVVVHYTANDAPSATDTANVKYASRAYKTINGVIYEANGNDKFRYGSAHWYIDNDSATLAIPIDENCWGCGDRALSYDNGCKGQTKVARDIFKYKQNYLTINYEICNNDTIKNSTKDWDMACDNAIEIIANDMIKYNIPITMVYRHHDISGKNCPSPFVSNSKAWENFKVKLQNKINELTQPKSLSFEESLRIVADKINTNYDFWYKKNIKYFDKFIIKVAQCELHTLDKARINMAITFDEALKIICDKAKLDFKYWKTQQYVDSSFPALIIKLGKSLS